MSIEEISYLKKEIDRLNQIITIILEQNELLKKENAYMKSSLASKDFNPSNDKIIIGEGNVPDSNDKIIMGEGKIHGSDDKINIGKSNVPYSNDKIFIGEGNVPYSYEEIMKGKGNIPDGIRKIEIGKSNEIVSLPEFWEINANRVYRVACRLKEAGLGKAKSMGKINIAKLLMHFHNKGRGSYSELRKLTSLSEGGLAKLLMSLKKRGLIHRTAYQQFTLSAAARQLLQSAREDEMNNARLTIKSSWHKYYGHGKPGQ